MLFARKISDGTGQAAQSAAQSTAQSAAPGKTEAAQQTAQSLDTYLAQFLHVPASWPSQAQFLQFCSDISPAAAILMMLGGAAYLIYGTSMFRPLVMLNLTLLGAWIGAFLGHQMGGAIPGMLIGAFIACALSFPLLKPGIAVVAGVVGFSLGASIWAVTTLDPRFSPAGGLIGATFFSMLTFILLSTTISISTSLQGSLMIVVGVIALLQRSPAASESVISTLKNYPYILLFAVIIPAVIGCIIQNTQSAPPAKK